MHIPSDADISPARVQISFMLANMFFAKHVPQAAANEPDSAVPEAFYDNTLGKRLGGGLLAVGIQGGEGLSA